jgi:hypothetical protein
MSRAQPKNKKPRTVPGLFVFGSWKESVPSDDRPAPAELVIEAEGDHVDILIDAVEHDSSIWI